MSRCCTRDETVLENKVKDFPPQMQQAIRHIIKYENNERKYTELWILECLFLSVKSKKTYLHLRRHNMLPMPTLTTLKKYFKSEFAFDSHLFRMLEKK